MRIKPFKGLVPSQSDIELVAAVPYDVVNTKEARSLAQGNPKSLLNVSRAEINFDDDIDPYSSQVYERAKTNFNALIEDNVLVRETEHCLYIYRQEIIESGLHESGRIPRTLECELVRDLVDSCVPGDVVIINGEIKVASTEEGFGKGKKKVR